SFVVTTAPSMGVRESRRITGTYMLTVDDYLSRASFDDEICRNSYYLDIHFTQDEFEQFKRGELDDAKRTARYGKGESHGIPYRCLTPEKLKNVIVAGRSISCDKRIQGSVRVMPVCLAMGEAAGMAAGRAAKGDRNFHMIDVQSL